jgi:hypothetical protein
MRWETRVCLGKKKKIARLKSQPDGEERDDRVNKSTDLKLGLQAQWFQAHSSKPNYKSPGPVGLIRFGHPQGPSPIAVIPKLHRKYGESDKILRRN